MDFATLQQLEATYLAQTYSRSRLDVEQGKGAQCQSAEGRKLIDFSAGIGVNSLGFTDPAWVAAVKEQIDKLCHISNLYYTQPMALLAEQLCLRTGMKRVFFANSGAEANEGAIKTARKYGCDKYGPHRHEIITLTSSFHGRTIATLAATGQDAMHQNFGPFPPGFVYAKTNDSADLLSKAGPNTCAILMECIQGEGGVNPLEPDFIKTIVELCAKEDILLMVDEVQTGVGRTGRFLCGEHYGLTPDLVTLAKGLGGGLPIGAVLFGKKTQDTLGKGDHGSTFGANPVVCAGALAVLERLDDAFLEQITQNGAYLAQALTKLPGITDVTGKGLMLGATLEEGFSNADIVARCGEKGLILLTAKEKLRFLPPLTITREEIAEGLSLLEEVLSECQ